MSIALAIYYGWTLGPLRERLSDTLFSIGESLPVLPVGEESLLEEASALNSRQSLRVGLLVFSIIYLLLLALLCVSLPGGADLIQAAVVFFFGFINLNLFLIPCMAVYWSLGKSTSTFDLVEERLEGVQLLSEGALPAINIEKEDQEATPTAAEGQSELLNNQEDDKQVQDKARRALGEIRYVAAIYWRTRNMTYAAPILQLLAAGAITVPVLLTLLGYASAAAPFIQGAYILVFLSLFWMMVSIVGRLVVSPIIWALKWRMDRTLAQSDHIIDGTLYPEHDVIETLNEATEPTLFSRYHSKFTLTSLMAIFIGIIAQSQYIHLLARPGSNLFGVFIFSWILVMVCQYGALYLTDNNSKAVRNLKERLIVHKK